MRIILYSQHLRRVSGLTTFEINFCKLMGKFHNIIYVYKTADAERLKEIEKYVYRAIQDRGNVFEGDICIFSSLQQGYPKPSIMCRKYIQMVHADIKAWNQVYEKDPLISNYVTPGISVQNALQRDFSIESTIIPNPLTEPNREQVLRLMTASRIAEGKGFERMIEFAKQIKKAGKKFIWEIYGEGTELYINNLKYKMSEVEEDIIFMGVRDDIQPYMRRNDYVVQLSDNESFCYAIYEALQVGVPCIVTNFEGVDKVIKNGKNGYIVNMELSDINLESIFTNIPNDVILKQPNILKLWLNLFN